MAGQDRVSLTTWSIKDTALLDHGDGNINSDGHINIDPTSLLSKTLLERFGAPPAYEKPHEVLQDSSHAITKDSVHFPLKLSIVLQVVGSRGDVQPFIALGLRLQKHGHRVRLATHNKFEAFVRKSGLEFFPIGGDPEELMSYMVRNPGLLPSMQSLRAGEISQKRAMITEMLDGCWRSCIERDPATGQPFVAHAIIANPPSFAHVHCAEALGIPLHIMFTMPWTPTRAFPHPLANTIKQTEDKRLANYLSYIAVEWVTWNGISDVVNNWRHAIGLADVPASEGPKLTTSLKIAHTYCWSPGLVPKPLDWPEHVDVCGFFFQDEPKYEPADSLRKFLEAGPPPVYIGFGSIVLNDPEHFSSILLEAVAAAGCRAIISRGWSKLPGHDSADIFWLDECPHEWLFQRVSTVVHHGGAGTTACGLRYGRPTVIVPFFGDQAFWGGRVAAVNAGPLPIPHKTLTAAKLASAIEYCRSQDVQTAAAAVATQMSLEDGVQIAVNNFHKFLPLPQMQCNALPDQPAVWRLRINKHTVYLSNVAVELLLKYGALNTSMLELHRTEPKMIKNIRWDPLTGLTSSFTGTIADMTSATAGILLEPYKSYQRATKTVFTAPASDTSISPARQQAKVASNMALASGKSMSKILSSWTQGVLVDLPLAVADGFHALPRLWGDEVPDHGSVSDWKTGGFVAGKSFLSIGDGLRDLVRLPVQGAKEEGSLGVVKGIARGTASLLTKTASGSLGLVAYTGDGLSKSLFSLLHSSTRKTIARAHREDGSLKLNRASGETIAQVMAWYYGLVPDYTH